MNASAKAKTATQIIVEIIEREAQKRFAKAMIDRVLVGEGIDGDEDSVFKVYVVLNDPEKVDPKNILSFIGHLRKALEGEAGDYRFPLVSYFSKGEAAELFPETV